MRRQIHLDGLRRQDPKTLEILVADALRLPILQLSAQTLADLLALSESSAVPTPLKRDLDGFAFRTGQQIADLPDGSVLEEFLEGLEALAPDQIPAVLRGHIAREAASEKRSAKARERMLTLGRACEGTEPAGVQLGTKAPRILRAEAKAPVDEPVHHKGARKAREKQPAAPRVARPKTNEDTERETWLSTQILERLGDYSSSGLREEVLIAGLRHSAKPTYPDLTAPEITKVLRGLADAGRVRRSAGRWSRPDRLW